VPPSCFLSCNGEGEKPASSLAVVPSLQRGLGGGAVLGLQIARNQKRSGTVIASFVTHYPVRGSLSCVNGILVPQGTQKGLKRLTVTKVESGSTKRRETSFQTPDSTRVDVSL
jgi:hypothetical protein